ncbi:DUF881 domain-containing protein [Radiobacillus sp. PE A8.2]|uniref:DUF881 domain-containing protein n=1 Tax=Radiobacillus sp. PE A8.2 TaxID=3380349 RepID=UPI00388FFB77
MKVKGRHVIYAFVLLVFGFLIAFSYQHTKTSSRVVQLSDQQWEKDYYYRQQLINMEEKNNDLRHELAGIRKQIQELETNLGEEKQTIGSYVETKKKLQMFTGELPIEGSGVEVVLKDSNYIPSEANANQYMVHEQHVHLVVNELFSAGAKAIAINGQRLFKDSYISCVGPVISVDGTAYPAPFIITAIGNPETLYSSINLTNGVIDKVVSDNIDVEMGKLDSIVMNARTTGER